MINKLVDISKNKPLPYANGKLNNISKKAIICSANYSLLEHKKHSSTAIWQKKIFSNRYMKNKIIFNKERFKLYSEEKEGGGSIITKNDINEDNGEKMNITEENLNITEENEEKLNISEENLNITEDNKENLNITEENLNITEENKEKINISLLIDSKNDDLNITEYIDKELNKKLEDELNKESQMSFNDEDISVKEPETTSSSNNEDEEEEIDVPFKVGDIILGEVIKKVRAGATVRMIDYPGYDGFLPSNAFPFSLMNEKFSRSVHPRFRSIEPGLIRQFKITKIADDVSPFKKGPMLSAYEIDLKILWKRFEQARDLAVHQHENMDAYIVAQNTGGIMVSLLGHSSFLPKSHMSKNLYQIVCKECDSQEYFYEKIKGMTVSVCPEVMEPARSRMIVSEVSARKNDLVRQLHIGGLITGNIRRIEPYGAFVGIDNTSISGLLHISNVSQYLVKDINEVFSLGEEVSAIILDMEEDYTRISLSTADLEENPGDIIDNKERVFENAPIKVKEIQKEIELQRQEYMDRQEN